MPADSGDDREREVPDSDTHEAGLAAEIDRLWDDLSDDADAADGDDDAPDSGEAGETAPTGVIDAVVDPPSGASQSAVEAAVAAVEDDGGTNRERDADDDLSV
jgi:hypothetical protein